jgi:ribonuclease VapC
MILDASAVVAIFLREPGYERIVDKLGSGAAVGIGTPTLAEAAIVLAARLGSDARPLLLRFIDEFGIVLVPFGDRHWREAAGAYQRFGRGRHGARLNFGDCLAYATARLAQRPLLCTGEDFAKTDLPVA